MYFNLHVAFTFDAIFCTQSVSYEPELFPAVLLSKWSTARVTLFVNGKGIVTGIRTPQQAIAVLKETLVELKDRIRTPTSQ